MYIYIDVMKMCLYLLIIVVWQHQDQKQLLKVIITQQIIFSPQI